LETPQRERTTKRAFLTLGILLLLGLGDGLTLLVVGILIRLIVRARVVGLNVEVRAVVNRSGLVGQAGACDSGNKGELGGGSARQG
jgi:hypothetical protein